VRLATWFHQLKQVSWQSKRCEIGIQFQFVFVNQRQVSYQTGLSIFFCAKWRMKFPMLNLVNAGGCAIQQMKAVGEIKVRDLVDGWLYTCVCVCVNRMTNDSSDESLSLAAFFFCRIGLSKLNVIISYTIRNLPYLVIISEFVAWVGIGNETNGLFDLIEPQQPNQDILCLCCHERPHFCTTGVEAQMTESPRLGFVRSVLSRQFLPYLFCRGGEKWNTRQLPMKLHVGEFYPRKIRRSERELHVCLLF
jgi:hypothetical protein